MGEENMWTSINKKLYIMMVAILVVGLAVGIVFVVMLDESTKEIVFLNINDMIQNYGGFKINNIITHLVILSSLSVLSLFIIGAPLIIFFAFYNGFSIGFIISSLTGIFGIKGMLYGLIYVIITKGIFLVMLLVLSVTLFKIIKNIMEKIIYKNKGKDLIVVLFKKVLLCIVIILIFDVIMYFFGSGLINIFNFLIN